MVPESSRKKGLLLLESVCESALLLLAETGTRPSPTELQVSQEEHSEQIRLLNSLPEGQASHALSPPQLRRTLVCAVFEWVLRWFPDMLDTSAKFHRPLQVAILSGECTVPSAGTSLDPLYRFEGDQRG